MSEHKRTLSGLFTRKSFPEGPEHGIRDLLSDKKIILYGAGDGCITFSVFVLRKYGLKAHVVLDRKFQPGDTHEAAPAFPPSSYRPTEDEKANAIVVVTVGKTEFHKQIFDCLRGLGFRNIMLSTDIYEYHLLLTPKGLKENGFGYYLANKDKIMYCLDLLADDLSREVFTRVIQTHMLRKPIPIPALPLKDQYFPKDIRPGKGYSRFINCGAYNGETVMRLNALFGKVEAIACFEPDPENFALLTRYLRDRNNELADEVVSFSYGVFERSTQLRFAGGNKINSMISDEGETVVQCVALDDAIAHFKPTFITMDVEGAELEALKGAETLIRESRPDLAICVYHAPNHVWDIPLYLHGLKLGYRFYLRNYTSFVTETVLYGISSTS